MHARYEGLQKTMSMLEKLWDQFGKRHSSGDILDCGDAEGCLLATQGWRLRL